MVWPKIRYAPLLNFSLSLLAMSPLPKFSHTRRVGLCQETWTFLQLMRREVDLEGMEGETGRTSRPGYLDADTLSEFNFAQKAFANDGASTLTSALAVAASAGLEIRTQPGATSNPKSRKIADTDAWVLSSGKPLMRTAEKSPGSVIFGIPPPS
jgi:hypothetical protein